MTDAPIHKIVDMDPIDLSLPVFFPGRALADLESERAIFEKIHVDYDNATVRLAIQSHVIQIGGATILVDTCIGEDKERPDRPHWNRRSGQTFLRNLAAAGFTPNDVDFVFCTHLHADHVGWNTRLENERWVPTFPKAKYLVGAEEFHFWRAAAEKQPGLAHGSYADSVAPIIDAGLYTRVSVGDEFVDGATILPLPGHTPGQIGLELAREDGPDLILCGDAVHTPVQISHADWTTFVCEDPAGAVATRQKLIDRVADGDALLLPAHLRKAPALGAKRLGGGRCAPVFCACDGTPV